MVDVESQYLNGISTSYLNHASGTLAYGKEGGRVGIIIIVVRLLLLQLSR